MAQSHACCTVPPVVSEGYKEKGQYTTFDGLKTYATGASGAKTGILVVYDIFGYFPQTIQGADILATGDKERQYQVFMPDFFEGKPVPVDYYPPDNDEKKNFVGNFFQTTAAPPKTLERIPKILKDIQSKNSSITQWAIVGFCWGGKIVNLSSQKDTLFKAAAAVHPAMVDANDAPGVSIPYIMLPSKGEDKGDVEKWQQGIKVKHQVEWFSDQEHGFMAARGDLKDPSVKKQYERGYNLLLNFFHENISA
ncbi:Dienelactone hydrolase-like protein 3 [Elsinoe fawcettii]|nr:Dienelactone hydrolase-like protein 3 [Elsinoe fawcettii]